MRARFGPPLVPLIILIMAFEVSARFEWIPEYLVPSPLSVLQSLWTDRDMYLAAGLRTGFCALGGLFLSFVVGVTSAVLFSFFDFARRAIYPYATFFQTVPIVAVAPVLVIWFGYGPPTVVASAFIVSFFPVLASSLMGLRSTDVNLMDLLRLYQASRWQILTKLTLPFALPFIFSGLRIAAGLSVIGAIVGEFVTGGGLGSVVDAARSQQRLDQVFAAVLISTLIGLLILAGVNLFGRMMMRKWHASETVPS
jgi:NitT/TauT family transport system permease protein